MMENMVERFVAMRPELSGSQIDLLEEFAEFSAITEVDSDSLAEGLTAASDAMRVIIDAVSATRIGSDNRGHYDEAWMNKAESEALKAEFFNYFNRIFDANILHTPHGN